MNGFVFVNSGQVLTIEPGTVIRGKPGQGNLASALIVARGGTILAEGERNRPIIFTVEGDDLTLGGIGRQTIIDHVEVISNADDGVEFFGGAVNCRNLVVSFCGDDAFDIDQGFRGKGQFWLAINSPDSDNTSEVTGGLQPVSGLPGSFPVIHNATLIGNMSIKPVSSIKYQSYGGGNFRNSIFLHAGKGIEVVYSSKQSDSYSLFTQGKLGIENNIIYPAIDPVPLFYTYSEDGLDLTEQNLLIADSMVTWKTDYNDPGISTENGYTILPPTTEFENLALYENDWFEKVTFKGAFGSFNWIEDWTLLYESGFINDDRD